MLCISAVSTAYYIYLQQCHIDESCVLYFSGPRCKFPVEWRGRYYQSGLGEINVRESYLTTKGTCVEQERDYFFFYNRLISRNYIRNK